MEGVVEEADEGSNRAGCVVVLGLAQQQSAAALDVTQIDIVAQAGSDDFGSAVYGQHNLRLGVVPGRVGTNANVAASAHGGQDRCFGEYLGIRPDAHFQILRPNALALQHLLECLSLR